MKNVYNQKMMNKISKTLEYIPPFGVYFYYSSAFIILKGYWWLLCYVNMIELMRTNVRPGGGSNIIK